MLRLKNSVKNFIQTVAVNPDDEIKRIENYANSDKFVSPTKWLFADYETKLRVELELLLQIKDFEETAPLKPNVWYSRERFDGNPNNYYLLEFVNDEKVFTTTDGPFSHSITVKTKKFMYVVPLGTSEQTS